MAAAPSFVDLSFLRSSAMQTRRELYAFVAAGDERRRVMLHGLCRDLDVLHRPLTDGSSAEAVQAALRRGTFDLFILDAALDGAGHFFDLSDVPAGRIPTIVLLDQEEDAPGWLRAGVTDCLVWAELDANRLASAIDRAVARKEAERVRQRAGETYRAVVENALDIITVIDENAVIRFESPSVERVLGYEPDELIGHDAFAYIHPEDVPALVATLQEGIREPGYAATVEYRFRHKDGSWRRLESRAKNLLHDAAVAGIVVNSRDVTERRHAEYEVRRLTAFYEQLLNDLPADLSVTDPEGRILFLNRASVPDPEIRAWLVGRTAEAYSERLGLDPAFARRRQLYIEEAVRRREIVRFEETIRSASGETHHRLRMASPVVEEDGTVRQVIGYGLDVTELKRQEAELRRSREQLRRLALRLQSVREEESARISREVHDVLGQALTALRMDVAWVDRALQDAGAPVRERLDTMKQLIDTTVQATRRIAADLRPGILDDLGLAAALEWQSQQFAARTGLACTFTDRHDALELDRDLSTALFRIFQEMLTNVARHADAARVDIVLAERDGALTLEVRDDGRGIRPQELENTQSLGLLGMRERVLPWRGRVHIESRPGAGTTVSVTVPLARDAEEPALP